jgi:hypothetical protein
MSIVTNQAAAGSVFSAVVSTKGKSKRAAQHRSAVAGMSGNDSRLDDSGNNPNPRQKLSRAVSADWGVDDAEWQAPPPGIDGECLNVDVRINALKVSEIDTVFGHASINLAIIFYWDDPRLADWDGTQLPQTLWGPKFKLINALPDMVEIDDDFVLASRSESGTRLKRVWRYMGMVDNPMHLGQFPFDLDTVDLNFMTGSHWQSLDGTRHGSMAKSRSYKLRRIRNLGEGKWFELKWSGVVSEWTMHGVSTTLRDDPQSASGTENSWLFVSFHLSRNSAYYFWKALFPLYMLNVLSLTTFHFDTNEIEARNNNVITCFLSAFAMQYVVSSALPKMDHLTRIDLCIVVTTSSLVFVSTQTCQSASTTPLCFELSDRIQCDTCTNAPAVSIDRALQPRARKAPRARPGRASRDVGRSFRDRLRAVFHLLEPVHLHAGVVPLAKERHKARQFQARQVSPRGQRWQSR